MALNGGPKSSPNLSISFMISFTDESELESTWISLSKNGEILLPLDSYPWSLKYGLCQDEYGVGWQLILSGFANTGQCLAPSLMFTHENAGKAEEAMHFYTNIFPHSYIHSINRYQADEGDVEGNVILADKVFTAMDNSVSNASAFTEGISIVIPCDTQEQIDHFWAKLTEEGVECMCGWLKDKYGVSWQIVPSILGNLMSDQDKSKRVIQAFLKMKKIDIETLLKA
jgi:predicted 3-demethylubiquinone-9 3-methyltransferase (glyoxalase superfamily)